MQPLVSVVSSSEATVIKFDFAYFDNAEGSYAIVDGNTGEPVMVFDAESGDNEVEFKPGGSELYGIAKGNVLLGIITAVDDVENVNLEIIREKIIAK